MYIMHKVSDMKTGDLAIAYQKVDNRLRKVAGGCWEWGGNNTLSAAKHRLQYKILRTPDGERETHAVKTIDLIRHKNGYRVDVGNRGYRTTCNNPFCFNPAHQIEPKMVGMDPFTQEMFDTCKTLRKHGWDTHYQRTYTSHTAYAAVLADKDNALVAPPDLCTKVDLHKVLCIAQMFVGGNVPNIADIISLTGLSFDELVYYGYAVSFIHRRMSSKTSGDTIQILSLMVEGKSNGEIAKSVGRSITEIHTFRGALYG